MNNLFFFTGENVQALQEKLRFWQQEFVKKYGESNLEVFEDLKQADLSRVLMTLESQPFLAEKRMVVIKDVPQGADVKKKLETEGLEKALEDLSEGTFVVFVSPKPDKRTRLSKLLLKTAQVETFEIPTGKALSDWVVQRLRQQGKTLEPRALQTLIFFCAEDVTRLASEIEKLSLLSPEMIRVEDVERCVSPTPEAKIFKALDFIGKGSPRETLQAFEKLRQSGEDAMMVFFMIVRQMRLLLQMRSMLDQQASRGEIQKRLKLAPFQVGMLSEQARRFKLETLKTGYQRLAAIDEQIKTGRIPLSTGRDELLYLSIDQFLCSLYE